MLRLVLPALLLFSLPVHAAGERLLFWKLGNAGAEVHLLGSMHLARADIYPLREQIMQAFDAADTLAVELDISGANQMVIQQLMLTRGTYPPGESIRDHLSASTWRDLQRHLAASGLPVEMMERLRPGLVVTTLSTMEMMKLGLSPEQGIDRYFLRQARGSKKIHELETIEQQLDLLLDFPQQDLFVQQTLTQLDDMEGLMSELVSIWKRGDAQALDKMLFDDEMARNPEYRPLYERMFDQRNRAMVRQIEEFLRKPGRYFVVVGAGHLVGDQGIVSLLQKKGFTPKQL